MDKQTMAEHKALHKFNAEHLDEHEKALTELTLTKPTFREGFFMTVLIGCGLIVWALMIRWWLS